MSDINVTPLVDVMLVLLVIFMVAAPMMTTAVPVALPEARAERIEVEQDTPLLTVANDRRIFLGETQVAFPRLEQALRNHAAIRREHKVYVQADADVPYGYVVQVFAVIKQAGVNDIGLVTDPAGGSATPPVEAP